METGNIILIAVLISLHLFGWAYNWLVHIIETGGHDRGITAALVAFGCLVTIVGSGFVIGLNSALLVLASFTASGVPMAIGAYIRYAQKAAAEEKKAKDMILENLND